MGARSSRRSSSSPPPNGRPPTGKGREASGASRAPRTRSAVPHRLLDLAPRVLLLQVAALVLHVLPARERDFHLGATVLPVQARRDQRQALLARPAYQTLDLAPVQQQLARALGL